MGNKRVSQLVELTTAEVQPDDLLLIVDSSAKESKKIQAQNLIDYLNSSGSILAVHAEFADTASYLLPGGINWTVPSSSYSLFASTAFSASHALLADNAVSSSYAQTATLAINVLNGGNVLVTASTYPITASWANNVVMSNTSSFLLYSGFPNGTASYALSASVANIANSASFLIGGSSTDTSSFALTASLAYNAENANSASYLIFSPTNGTASYALVSENTNNINVTLADSASYLIFSPDNGTASYALVAQVAQHKFNSFGLFPCITQSTYQGSIDNLNISSSLGTAQPTLIEAFGTAVLFYTASISNVATFSLIAINRLTGQTSSLDSIELSNNVTPIMDQWNTLATGSIKIPFVLAGQDSLVGNYFVAVTSSAQNLKIDSGRTVKFTVTSYADNVSASVDLPVNFYIAPTNAPITFSSFAGGPFYDSLPGLLFTGSSNIKTIDVANQSITDIKFTWKCGNLTDLSCSNNNLLTNLDYSFPNTMSNLYCSSCSLTNIADLSNTQIINFDCGLNILPLLPSLPDTITTLNCSYNPLISLPDNLPTALQTLISDFTNLTGIFLFNDNLVTASLNNSALTFVPDIPIGMKRLSCNNNTDLTLLPDLSETSMSYLDASVCDLFTLPSMSVSMSSIDISSNTSLPAAEVVTATDTLVNNLIYSGSFTALGYDPTYPIPFYANLLVLQSRAWNINVVGFP